SSSFNLPVYHSVKILILSFFFSSSRRHTRSKRDWSSDVCSSDLLFYIITDNTVVSALDAVVGVSEEQQIPLVVGEPDSLEGGGFATYGIDYYTIGYRT